MGPGITGSYKILIFRVTKYVVYVTLYWECSRFVFLYKRSKFPHLKQTAKRIVTQSMVVFLFIFFAGFIIAAINYYYPVGKGEPFLGRVP